MIGLSSECDTIKDTNEIRVTEECSSRVIE